MVKLVGKLSGQNAGVKVRSLVGLIQSGVEGLGGFAITSATPAAKAEPWQWREGQK